MEIPKLDKSVVIADKTTTRSNIVKENMEKLSNEKNNQSKPPVEINKKDLEKEVNHLNQVFEMHYTNLKYKVHEETDRYFVQVIDQSSRDVIREIPAEKFLDMVSKMMDFMGLMVDERI